ncbi:MAG: hypothetical protein K2M91_07715, partial [Lachnospiraceae bacterium]|nr:hypothetical protein [Lachnospiraceae bacterium]
KEKKSLLKIEIENKLTMGKITESIDDSGYRNLREQIALTGKTIDALQARIQDVSERTRVSSAEMAAAFENNLKNLRVPPIHEENIEKLQMSLDKAGIKLEELQTKLANGLTMGRITENIDDSGYRNLREQIALTENQIEALRTRMQEVGDTSQYVGLLQSSLNGLRAVAHAPVLALEAVGNAVRSIPSKSIELASSAMQTLGSAAINTAKIITGSLLNGLKNTVLKIGSLSKSIAGLDKSNKGLNVSLGKGFSTLLKYGLGNRSVYTLINKMRRAIVEGFKNLAQYSNEVNANISMLKGSFNQLKNSMAAMLAPIFNAIAPALNQLIQLIIKATNVINQFIAALSGSSSWIRAKNQVVDYANSIKKAAKAAQKGARQFDELKMISTDNGGNDGGTNPGDMFETVPIDDKIMDWMNKFRDMWKNADFTELGSAIGDWLKNTLDNIDLDGIQTKAAKLGSSLATFLNGIFETDGLGYSIGNTLAQSINTAFEFLNEFVHKLHWDSLGKFIAETLNGLFSNIEWDLIKDTFFAGAKGLADAINSFDEFLDWNAISTTISNAFNTLVGTIRIFVGNVDWKQLGADIGKTISDAWIKIDWSEVGAMVGESFIAFFDFISSAIENVDWEGVAQTFEDFITGIDFSGVADSFFEAVGAAFGGLSMVLGKLLYDAVDSAKKYFQGKIEECGGNVVEGILKGIVDAITGIGQWVYDHIFSPFIKGFKEAFGIHSPSTVMEEQGNYIMEGLLNGITSLVDKVADTWESMKSTAVETWNTVKESLSETWENIKSDASTKFDTIKSNVSEAWENLKSDTSDKWSTIKSDLSDIWSDTKENASETFGNIKDSITDSWENLKKNTSDIWEQIKNVIKNPINAIISFINGLIGGVTSGINAMTSALNSISFDIPDWIPGIGGGKFGFDIPQISVSKIPMLAKGGIAMQYTPAIIGEAGAEAILPLTNSRAMGMIADSILDNISDGGYDNTDDREREIYSVVYNAVSAALNNSKRLREIDENIEKGHVIEADGRVFAKLVQAEANETFRRTGKPYFAF